MYKLLLKQMYMIQVLFLTEAYCKTSNFVYVNLT